MFKIPTQQFKIMVAKAAKGASCNKILPVTSLISINLTDNQLCLTTTDTENTVEVYRANTQGDNMNAVVGVELFASLIAKQTCEAISLTLSDDNLVIKGNGTYKIPVMMDEEGMVKFPEFDFSTEDLTPEVIELSSLRRILEVNKSSLCTSADQPQLCAYYVHAGDENLAPQIISTNLNVICFNTFKLFNARAFISPAMLELLVLNTQEKIQCFRRDGMMLFVADDYVVHGPENDMVEDFPLDQIAGYLELNFPSCCTVSRAQLQSVLDRLALFIEAFDKNAAYFTFTDAGLQVTSKQSSSDEVISYHSSTNFMAMQMLVDIPAMKAELDSTPGETVDIYYGHDAALAIANGNVKKVISLMDEDVAEEQIEIPEEQTTHGVTAEGKEF